MQKLSEILRGGARKVVEAGKRARTAISYLEADAELERVIKEEMTEAEAKRAVKRIAKARIAERARLIQRTTSCPPSVAIRQAREEWDAEFGKGRR
jgi:hypothetical protein